MAITRREFLGYTAGAVGIMGLPLQSMRARPATDGGFQRWWTMYSDPNNYGCESMRGYWSALPPGNWSSSIGDPNPFARLSLLIAPYIVSLLPQFVDTLRDALHGGTTVLLESGAGFADHSTFRRHRRWLREDLETRVCSPVDPWAHRAAPGARYIELTWPHRARIRDFGRVVAPADEQPGEIIAWAGNLAVAFRRRVGRGTLIYLGSPVGPACWAGDLQAKRWLHAVTLAA